MRSLPVRLYASFPATSFGGNIAGVVHDDVGLGAEEMQNIAAELGAPTTGFVRRRGQTTVDVRFFSACNEMGMCGHVTIGIFASMFDDEMIPKAAGEYRQVIPAGEIIVSVANNDGVALVWMRQPPPRFGLIKATKAEMASMLGVPHNWIRSVASSSTALSHLFVELSSVAALASIHPDDDALRNFSKTRSIDTIGVWCLNGSERGGARVRVRDLCHGVGDPEEAASGTTNGALACLLWQQRQAEADAGGVLTITAEQGFEMGRPSLITSRLMTSVDGVAEVKVGGHAKRRLSGTYML